MASGHKQGSSVEGRKLVVLGLPWEVSTDELREYMEQFGTVDDAVVMKDRATGKSRGFGYVTFSTSVNAEKAFSQPHTLKGRKLEVKLATPKEDMKSSKSLGTTRIFVARIPHSATEDTFRSYFTKYGIITDCYMPKDPSTKKHRGIGFVTFETPSSVDKLMKEKHELEGAHLAIDRATPKEEMSRPPMGGGLTSMSPFSRYVMPPGYIEIPTQPQFLPSAYSSMESYGRLASESLAGSLGAVAGLRGFAASEALAATLRGGMPSFVPTPPPEPIRTAPQVSAPPKQAENPTKVFVGKLPAEATVADLKEHFEHFGPIEDIYIPKDANKSSHRGFGFITFVEEAVAAFVAGRPHKICGKPVVVDRATPPDSGPTSGRGSRAYPETGAAVGGSGGPMRSYLQGTASLGDYYPSSLGAYSPSLEYQTLSQLDVPLGLGASSHRTTRGDTFRYRPY